MYLGYIHNFRALAILFIVAGHSIDAFFWDSGNGIDIERVLRIAISNGSTLFIFIAGYLFQHLLAKYENKKYFISKLKNVIIPYFIISIPAILVFVFLQERDTVWPGFYEHNQWTQAALFYLTGLHLAPLWFIPMISMFYIIAPLLRFADRYKFFYYLLPAFIVLSCFVDRGMPQQSFVHFFSAYVLGMWCSKYKETINLFLQKNYFLTIAALLAIGFALAEYYFMTGTMSYLNYLQKLAVSLFFLGLFIRNNDDLKSPFISLIADVSFGIFFIHSYALTMFKESYKAIFAELPQGTIFSYTLLSITILLICSYIIVLLRKLLGKRSRLLIGS